MAKYSPVLQVVTRYTSPRNPFRAGTKTAFEVKTVLSLAESPSRDSGPPRPSLIAGFQGAGKVSGRDLRSLPDAVFNPVEPDYFWLKNR